MTTALALGALAAILAVALGGGSTSTSGHGGHVEAAGALHPRARQPPSRSAPSLPAVRSTPPSVPVSTALAVQLEARAHDLVAKRRYGDAVPLLRRALAATGKQLGECLQPDGLSCLTYAYALFDLGRALRLSGKPDAAVPVLSRRLEIDNQRATVTTQLALARDDVRVTGGARTAA